MQVSLCWVGAIFTHMTIPQGGTICPAIAHLERSVFLLFFLLLAGAGGGIGTGTIPAGMPMGP
eukprot:13275233-Ditylum_brightwellii.AAC.1